MQVRSLDPLRIVTRLAAAMALALAFGFIAARPAHAVPAFAAQTGQPCQMCHVGGFGPQLTAFGREFKLKGYTQRSGNINVPLSIMAVASYIHTQADQPPAPHFGANDNVAVDQVSVFLAGGVGDHFGGFVQTTYDGIGKSFTWDNTDLRAVTTLDVKGANVVLGASLNNNPTVQDAWNTLPAWGYPYTSSALAPSPPAAPLLAGSLAQETVGLTGYAWIDSEVYLEGGGYVTPGSSFLTHVGADPVGIGDIHGVAPYVRLAYQKSFGTQNLEVGAFFMQANIYPGRERTFGTDRYTDWGLDASYQWPMASTDVFTVNARYIDERQALNATFAAGNSDNPRDSLRSVQADASYYWRNRIGGTIQVFNTTGSFDGALFGGKPDSTGVTLQLDGAPWGASDSPLGRRFNLRLGVQYTAYTEFNGARAGASDNNTLRVFTWLAY
jgi:hypothetical protein